MEAFEGTDLEVVIEQTTNWQRDQALTLMENWIQSGQEFDVVAAQYGNGRFKSSRRCRYG